jgi:ATP-dependent DNA helicase RecG
VTKEFKKWAERLKGYQCSLLHGKMAAEEKDVVMEKFRAHQTDVLVSTTVIEVGVDVPNANVMLIYNAERFGLAQLHQLRGRIGRGEHKSYCVLMCDPEAVEAIDRLRIMEQTRDGFKIAEEDLVQRGPGEVLGTQQSGLPGMKFPEYLGDSLLVEEARQIALTILESA